MPELPEAENVRTRLQKYGAGRSITHVRVVRPLKCYTFHIMHYELIEITLWRSFHFSAHEN
jgi:formamidopyrimidine-DNA glycosylase